MMNTNNHGGRRTGAGRKKGTTISKNTTVFYAKCTEEEKQKLKDFLNKLRGLAIFLFVFLVVSPCFAFDVEYPSNIPDDVHISIEQGFVYAGSTYKENFKNPNSFKISAYRTGDSQYYLLMNEAVLIADNQQHKLVQPSAIKYVLNNEPIAPQILFKGQNSVLPAYYAPVENIYYTKLLNRYSEPVKMSFIGAYAFPVKFNDKRSVLKDKGSCTIQIPLLNIDTNKKEILTFNIAY